MYLGKEIKKKIELYTPLLLLLSKKVTEEKENKYSHNQNNAEWNKALIQNGFFYFESGITRKMSLKHFHRNISH